MKIFDIKYREECFRYLVANGFTTNEAFELAEIIRKGTYRHEKKQICKERLSEQFIEWAKNVTYLPSEKRERREVNKVNRPAVRRTIEKVNEKLTEAFSDPETIYAQKIINDRGGVITADGNYFVVTDLIANELYENNLLETISVVASPKTYLCHDPNSVIEENTTGKLNREEEKIAHRLFERKVYRDSDIDLFVDYQVPICRDSSKKQDANSHYGKVDLIALSHEKKEIYLMELKKYDSKETLLRCATECYTYWKQIKKNVLIKEIADIYGEKCKDYRIVPAVLAFEGMYQHSELNSNLFTNVQRLLKKLGIKFFAIDSLMEYEFDSYREYISICKIKEIPVVIKGPLPVRDKRYLQKELDKAIMQTNKKFDSELTSGYAIGEIVFEDYLSNGSFKDFFDKMPEKIKHMYGEGAGSELEERKNKKGEVAYPPKMASFGSSSRMIYNLAPKDECFVFEKKLPTTVGGTANLDGYIETEDSYVFVEAKCREPYGEKTNIVGTKYRKFYEHLNRSGETEITCEMGETDQRNRTMTVTYSWQDTAIEYFDIKQMLCHLLGIGTAIMKKGEYADKRISFLYLIYNPETLEFENKETKMEICDIYYKTCDEAKSAINRELFKTVLVFLKKKYYPDSEVDIDDVVDNFSFSLCCQLNFLEKLEK